MKKPYPGKPDIIFEEFTLSTSISASCEVKGNFAQAGACGWIHPLYGDVVFLSKVGGCTFQRPGGGYSWGDLWVCLSTHEDTLFSS